MFALKVSIKSKVSGLIFGSILVSNVVLGTYGVMSVHKDVTSLAQTKLQSDLNLSGTLIAQRYPGAWKMIGKTLYKGKTPMNGNFSLVDELRSLTGDDVTIFMGDTRVATTVRKPTGERAVGTKASDVVVQTTIKGGKTYKGSAVVVGIQEQTIYQPLVDPTGRIIGMLFIGVPSTPFDALSNQFRDRFFMVAAAEIILIVFLLYLVIGRTLNPLKAIIHRTQRIASGDLQDATITVSSMDEIGTLGASVNEMTQNLRALVQNIREAMDTLSASSEELAASSEEVAHTHNQVTKNLQSVSDGADEQASRVEENTNTLAEIEGGVQQIRQSSSVMNQVAAKTVELASTGAEEVRSVSSQMTAIQQSVGESSMVIGRLSEQASTIQGILGNITEISTQTKMLSLNATIEAARAGEAGKGFAVVANEVKRLSDRAAESVVQIQDIIHQTLNLIEQTGKAMHRVEKEVEVGRAGVAGTERTFVAIEDSVHDVTGKIQTVAGQTDEMSERIEGLATSLMETVRFAKDISAMVKQVASASEQQLGSMHEVNAASDSLIQMAEVLQQMIHRFQL